MQTSKRAQIFGFAATLLLTPSASWAAIGSCTTTHTLAFYAVSGAGNQNAGCYDTDKSFTNFTVTDTGSGTTQTTATDQIQGSSTFTTVTSPWTVSASFTPTTASNWQITGSFGTTLQASINYWVNSSGAFITPGGGGNTEYPTATPGDYFAITSASLANAVGSTGGNGQDNITIQETFCVGTGACTAANTITLTATFSGNTDTTASFTCAVGGSVGATIGTCQSANSGVFNFAATFHPITLNVTNTYSLEVHNNTTDTLSRFDNIFGEAEFTPEPSSFVLMGSGVLALVAARRKLFKR